MPGKIKTVCIIIVILVVFGIIGNFSNKTIKVNVDQSTQAIIQDISHWMQTCERVGGVITNTLDGRIICGRD